MHQTIARVTDSIESNFHFNTAISGIMELVNQATGAVSENEKVDDSVLKATLETILTLLFPFVPHFSEELWEISGHPASLNNEQWPVFDPEIAKEEELTIVVQVNGKVRANLQVPHTIENKELQDLALNNEKIIKYVANKEPKKVIVVQKKLVNIVL